eukprot:2657012-Pyramimonas_sp.AAC.1
MSPARPQEDPRGTQDAQERPRARQDARRRSKTLPKSFQDKSDDIMRGNFFTTTWERLRMKLVSQVGNIHVWRVRPHQQHRSPDWHRRTREKI